MQPSRLLLAVSPRVLSDALLALLADAGIDEIVQVAPGTPVAGRFDLALVDAGASGFRAQVTVELLASGGCVVVGEGEDGCFIELRDASGLLAVVGTHLGVLLGEGQVEHDPGAPAGRALDVEVAAE